MIMVISTSIELLLSSLELIIDYWSCDTIALESLYYVARGYIAVRCYRSSIAVDYILVH